MEVKAKNKEKNVAEIVAIRRGGKRRLRI